MQIRPHLILACILLAGCGAGPERETALAEAFAGPIELKLREEVTPGTKIVAQVKHGDRLEVLQIRRRFVRVRTPDGVVGWTDVRQLMTPQQMEELKQLFELGSKFPSQGDATVYSNLNMHTLPLRQSPSFYQIKEGDKVVVLAHQIAPRSGGPELPGFTIPKPPPPARKKKEKEEPKVPPPPKPAAPEPPEDWLELSKTDLPEEPPGPEEEKKAKAAAPSVRMEDWNFVRTPDGKAGWVLARNLTLAIPDEVAQYAEGHRITSYFSLGTVNDNGEKKNHWLWTTHSGNAQPFQYDGFRVFIWSLRRHRYETSYIERRVKGYFPTQVTAEGGVKFSLLLEDEDGQVYRKTFAFDGNLVRRIDQAPAKKPEPLVDLSAKRPEVSVSAAPREEEQKSWKDRIKSLFGRS